MVTQSSDRVAVYLPYATLVTGIATLEVGLPDKLHKSVWRSQSGGIQAQLLSAFKFLRLIDEEGVVQPRLKQMVEDRENRDMHLRAAIEAAYPSIPPLAASNASQNDLENAMRAYGVAGTTLDKAVRFYLQAAEHLGLVVSPHWRKGRATITPSATKKKSSKPKIKRDAEESLFSPPLPSQDMIKVDLGGGVTVTLNVTGPITQLSREDRDFLFGIVDTMRDHEAKQREPKASVDGKSVVAVMEAN